MESKESHTGDVHGRSRPGDIYARFLFEPGWTPFAVGCWAPAIIVFETEWEVVFVVDGRRGAAPKDEIVRPTLSYSAAVVAVC